ncbi:MAG: aminopeptidase P family N-terminal domain-containing protein, partial [Rhodospirillaceae bacterium]|nr:aminopeptidase P family N-terminal domain-containing protein [Rhodospirillaceae bacterium]
MAERASVPDGAGRAAKLDAVRDRLGQQGVSAFLVPRTDAHRGEWVAECDNRLSWLTGFSGSMGLCVVSADRSALFVDGRYTLQARRQVDGAGYEINELNPATVADWISGAVGAGGQVGFDPWLHTKSEIERLERKLAGKGISLCRVRNIVDEVRQDCPDPPRSGIFGHPPSLSGETSASKRQRMAEKVKSAGADAAELTLPDSIAWLLNIRGSD